MVKAKALVDKTRKGTAKPCKRGRSVKNPKSKNKKDRVYKKTCSKPKKQIGRKGCSKRGKKGRKPKSILKRKCQRKASASNLCHVRFEGCKCSENGQTICLQCLGNICDLAKAGVTPSEMQLVLDHRFRKAN